MESKGDWGSHLPFKKLPDQLLALSTNHAEALIDGAQHLRCITHLTCRPELSASHLLVQAHDNLCHACNVRWACQNICIVLQRSRHLISSPFNGPQEAVSECKSEVLDIFEDSFVTQHEAGGMPRLR